MNEYIILTEKAIKEISEEISEKKIDSGSSSFLVNSKHGNANIKEVDRKDFIGREHIGMSGAKGDYRAINGQTYNQFISELISAVLRWIDYGSIPSEILFNIDFAEKNVTVTSYLFVGKSKDNRLFSVRREYDVK